MRKARALALALLCAPSAQALQWVPVAGGEVMLGQIFQRGKASDWQGNASLQLSPAVKLDDSWGLIPTYAGAYQGTKSATELAGGGQLFQDSQSHLIHLKAVYARGPWRLKPGIGHLWSMLRETADEGWGKGLFDYRKPSFGLDSDYAFAENLKASAGFSYYELQFPNYRSLESAAAVGLGREQAGARTLDSRNYSWSLSGEFPLPFEGGWGKASANLTDRDFEDQNLVVESGELTRERRSDLVKSISATAGYGRAFSPKAAGVFSCSVTLSRYDSNQNHYDAELNVFTRNYYSYEERSVQPKISLILGSRKAEYSVSYLRVDRDYISRLAQTPGGAYTATAVQLSQDSFLFDLTIPLTRGLSFVAHSALTDSSSNMRYEKTFRYNYTLNSHLLGLAYSY